MGCKIIGLIKAVENNEIDERDTPGIYGTVAIKEGSDSVAIVTFSILSRDFFRYSL